METIQNNFQALFMDKLSVGIIQLTEGVLSYCNDYAKEVFPELDSIAPEKVAEFLGKTMGSSSGKFTQLAKDFIYSKEESSQVIQYTILPESDSPLNTAHLDRVIQNFRSDIMTIELAKQEIVDLCFFSNRENTEEQAVLQELAKEMSPPMMKINQNLFKLKRLLCNLERVQGGAPEISLYSLDLLGLLRQVTIDVNSLFDKPVLSCNFDSKCSGSLIVYSSKTELVQVILGFLSNALVYGDSLEISVKKQEDMALVQVHDKNSPVVQRPLMDILRGSAQGRGFSPNDGAGLSLLAIQNLLQGLGTQLMTEAPSTGGIRYSFHIPVFRGQETDLQLNATVLPSDEEEFGLLQELSPILPSTCYSPEDIDQDF